MKTVTFRSIRTGASFVVGFDCGEDNMRLILREAWNRHAEIVSVVDEDAPKTTAAVKESR